MSRLGFRYDILWGKCARIITQSDMFTRALSYRELDPGWAPFSPLAGQAVHRASYSERCRGSARPMEVRLDELEACRRAMVQGQERSYGTVIRG